MNVMSKINNATILITGGAGFVGSHLVEELCHYNPKKLFVLDSLVRGKMNNLDGVIDNENVEFIEGDICDDNLIDNIISDSDYCFHLAALRINACAADPVLAFETMVKGTFNLINSAKNNNLKKIIYSSSASVYGLADSFPTVENNHPYDNKTFYGVAKLFGEQTLRSYYHMYGLNYAALRYFNVYGPRMDTEGRYTEVLIKWLKCIKDNESPKIFGEGNDTMDFVYVKDVVKANILALEKEITDEVFNVGSGQEISLKNLLSNLLSVNNSQLEPLYVSLNDVNPVSRRLADVTKAEEILSFEAKVTLIEGLKELSQWYFSDGVLK